MHLCVTTSDGEIEKRKKILKDEIVLVLLCNKVMKKVHTKVVRT